MDEYRVTCVVKPDRFSRHEHITKVGLEGQSRLFTREELVGWIDAGTYRFYTLEAGRKTYVYTREGPTGRFLQTRTDNQWQDNLLSFRECLI